MLLSVSNMSVGYKGLMAVQDVSFHVDKGEVVSLIGSIAIGQALCHLCDGRRASNFDSKYQGWTETYTRNTVKT